METIKLTTDNKEIKNNTNYFKNISVDMIENDILTFLNTKDLFFSVRGVSTEWSEYMRNIWCNKIKDEMADQVKAIDLVYEKEVFAKTYEFKIKYLINYRSLLTMYITNTSITAILNNLTTNIENENIKGLIKLFVTFLQLEQPLFYVDNDEKQNLSDYFSDPQNLEIVNDNILNLLKTETFHDLSIVELNNFKLRFGQLNKEILENFSEQSKLIYSFLLGLIEYQILKIDIKEIIVRIDKLSHSIRESAQVWPKKRIFFERAYKILLFSKNSYDDLKVITKIFEDAKIKHPLIDFNDDSLKLIIDLKDLLNNPEFDPTKLEETIFENILKRRILLSKKILILEKFLNIYKSAKISDNIYNIKGVKFDLKQFLWSLKFSSNSEEENVNEDSILKTRRYLDDHFDFEHAIIYPSKEAKDKAQLEDHDDKDYRYYKNNYDDEEGDGEDDGDAYYDEDNEDYAEYNKSNIYELKNSIKDEEDQIILTKQQQSHIQELKTKGEQDLDILTMQKNNLTMQKEKTETVLIMLKKFLSLKEQVLKSNNKYKFIVYVLSKIKKDENDKITFDSIEKLINDLDLSAIDNNNTIIFTEEEIDELENSDLVNPILIDIENQLFKYVDDVISKINNK